MCYITLWPFTCPPALSCSHRSPWMALASSSNASNSMQAVVKAWETYKKIKNSIIYTVSNIQAVWFRHITNRTFNEQMYIAQSRGAVHFFKYRQVTELTLEAWESSPLMLISWFCWVSFLNCSFSMIKGWLWYISISWWVANSASSRLSW